MLKKWILGDRDKAYKQGFIWNLIASAINAAEAVVILMIATRTVGIEMAGVLTIAFTISNLMMCIGKYGVRNFQVTDTNGEFEFVDYYKSRILTILLMLSFSILYVVYSMEKRNYNLNKSLIVISVVIIYSIECYEDVFLAGLQRDNRLDIGAKMFSVRWFITLSTWALGLIVIKDTLSATVIAVIVDVIILILLTGYVKDELGCKSRIISGGILNNNVKNILKSCFPLCITALTSIYIPNAAKYAIDTYMGDVAQANYGFISMPVFVVDVVSFVIFQPILPKISLCWNEKRYSEFVQHIRKVLFYVLGFSVVILLAAYALGIPVLSLLYAADLDEFKKEFMILMLSGVMLGIIGLLYSVMTILRKQKYMMVVYIMDSCIAFLVSRIAVAKYGIMGASVTNIICMLILLVVLALGTVYFIYKGRR